ncbi:hypothetical protein [Aquimarina latercula]|uniref:hypothetical protein n=1 Tax=Aquimarina latercula TaxID=987 RepID=UPI0004831052|nr:hypothetical protein [Aquimarina latercula]
MRKKSKYGMPPPKTRKEFEHNINLVLEEVFEASDKNNLELIRNRMVFTIPHLERVRYLPNRRLDLNTVNEMLRNQSNMMHWMSMMPPVERVSEEE